MYHHAPLSLCLQLLFVLCLAIIHFKFLLCLCPPLRLAFPSPPSLSPWPLSFTLPLCSSVKALRNYSQWFFFFSLPAWASAECSADSWGAPRSATVAAESTSPPLPQTYSICRKIASPWPGESTLQHRQQTLKCVAVNPISLVCLLSLSLTILRSVSITLATTRHSVKI